MTASVNSLGDFTATVDGLEAITLRRPASGNEQTIGAALRSSSGTEEADEASGNALASLADWSFELPESVSVEVGDHLVDSAGVCWTVLVVSPQRLSTRVRCKTQALAIRYALAERVTIEQAVWQDGASGPEIASWRIVRPSVPAAIQAVETVVDHDRVPTQSTTSYRISMVGDLDLHHDHRLVDARGSVYRVDRYVRPKRSGDLALVEASRDGQAEIE